MKKIRVAVADDHAIFLSGFVNLLKTIDHVEVVVQANDGHEVVDKLRFVPADVVFLDYRMPVLNGINAAKLIRDRSKDIKILILSAYDEEEIVAQAFACGANGYLTKGDRPEEIWLAIDSVIETGIYVNQRASRTMVNQLNSSEKPDTKFMTAFEDSEVRFSMPEIMVIRLMAKEYSTREIAEFMLKSDRTIDAYRAGIMKKTGAKNSAGIIMYGVRYGIIELDRAG
jgi:two-component system, NarL family, response regulator DegU